MILTALQLQLLSNGVAICVNSPRLFDRWTNVLACSGNKTIHASVETRGFEIVALCEGDISTMLPIIAIAWPFNSKFDIWPAVLSDEQYRLEQQEKQLDMLLHHAACMFAFSAIDALPS